MKRWIHAAEEKKTYSTDYEVSPGLVPGLLGEGNYGEQTHKSYRGITIRDFRNDWMGEEDFEILKDDMDKELEAYDLICESNSDMKFKLTFFNIGANDSVSLYFIAEDGVHTFYSSIHGPSYFDDDKSRKYSPYSYIWGVHLDTYDSEYIKDDDNPSAKKLAQTYADLLNKMYKREATTAKMKSTISNKNSQIINELQQEAFSDSELTVPIDIEIDQDRGKWNDPNVIDDIDYMASCLEEELPIEDVNRYFKQITVRYMLSGTSICLYPKVKEQRLRADWKGKTTETQFNGACRAIGRKIDEYIDKMLSKYS